MFDEEESKKLRIFQRYERQELQLIIERCNEVAFDYVCVPSIRSDQDLCFGSKTPRKIHLFADDKTVNSFMRKCFKENFPEPVKAPEEKKSEEEEKIEVKPTHPFSSKVPRFQDITIDSSGVYRRRRRKTKQTPEVDKKTFSAFGSSSNRDLLTSRNPTESVTPGVGAYNITKKKKNPFGLIKPAFEIICAPTNLDQKCGKCEEKPKNIFWKSKKGAVLCRSCYNIKTQEIKRKTRGIVDKLRKLQVMEEDYEKKRYCDFYHEHNLTTAAVRILPPKEFHKRIHQENFLNTVFDY